MKLTWAMAALTGLFPIAVLAQAPAAAAPKTPAAAAAPAPVLAAVPAERINFELRFPAEKGGGKAVGTAGTIEYQRDDFATASGSVEIKYEDYDIKADSVTVDLGKKLATAVGHVVIDQGARRLTGDQAMFDLETKTGILQQASAYLEPDYYFSGTTIRKTGDDTYEVEHGTFTSCKGDSPAWSFRMSHANVRVEGYAHIKNLSLRVKKAPVLYLPYLVWPVKKERASGLLVPQFGYTNLRGGYLGLSYYQVLGRSYDTTLLIDGYEKGYYGFGDEFRYQPSAGTKGLFRGYVVHDPVTNEARWKVSLDQETTDLPWGLRGVINFRDYSDFNFFRDFERDLRQTTQRTLYSQGFVSGSWGAQSINLSVDDRQTFITDTSTLHLQKLPSLEYRVRALRLFGAPLYLDLVSSASYLSLDRGGSQIGKYSRVDAAPSISAPLSTIPWFSLSVNAGGHATSYGDSVTPTTGAFTGDGLTRVLATAGMQAVGPSFSKIFDSPGGKYKIKHVIEPRWQYSYLGTFDQANEIPLFDEIDQQNSTNQGRVTLVNRFLARPNVKHPAVPSPAGVRTPATASPATTAAPATEATATPPTATAQATAADSVPAAAGVASAAAAAVATAVPTATTVGAAVTPVVPGTAPAPPAVAAPVEESAREVLAIEISRGYSFDKLQPLEGGIGQPKESQLSPVTGLVRFTPSLRTNFRAQVNYSPLFGGIQSTQLTGQYSFKLGTAGVTWFTHGNPALQNSSSLSKGNQIGLTGGIAVVPGRLRLDAQVNYDIQNKLLQQDRLVLTYTSQCWGLRVEYRDFQSADFQLTHNRQHDWRFAISLKNIGDILDFGVGDTVNAPQ